MHRICTSIAHQGYHVTLVGRKLKNSKPLQTKPFQQKRLWCLFKRGFFFYAEYNVRLFFFLLLNKMDMVCAVDLDTSLACLFSARIRKIFAIYDAHEYFTELKEVNERPFVKRVWSRIENYAVPKFDYCYTVSKSIADEFENKYKKRFEVIRNVPYLKPIDADCQKEAYLFYGGAVNEARGFEYLIPAMQYIKYKLIICGDGNFMSQLIELIKKYGVCDQIELKGMLLPQDLDTIARKATIGLNLVAKEGLNQYYSLANKFFDYMQAGLPQVSMNFPEYRAINNEHEVAVLIDDLSTESVAATINSLLRNKPLQNKLRENCLRARKIYNWQNEEKKLADFYGRIFNE
jgi:glycosyltransferase involved in cell wall biosynthesis